MHSPDWWRPAMAPIPAERPDWPLPGTEPRFWRRSFGYKRPSSCKSDEDCKRWHCGVDLTRAEANAPCVATEDGVVVRVDKPWSVGTRYTAIRHKSGVVAIYGGLLKGSTVELGIGLLSEVKKGQQIGVIDGGYKMLHFELYEDDGERNTNSRWWRSDPPPVGLLNPINYIQAAAGLPVTRETPQQRHEALSALGYYAGELVTAWNDRSKDALKAAQSALGLDADGVWGDATEAAIAKALGTPAGDAAPPPTEGPEFWTTQRKVQAGLGAIGLVGLIGVLARRRMR